LRKLIEEDHKFSGLELGYELKKDGGYHTGALIKETTSMSNL
jgi:hypothetical protein